MKTNHSSHRAKLLCSLLLIIMQSVGLTIYADTYSVSVDIGSGQGDITWLYYDAANTQQYVYNTTVKATRTILYTSSRTMTVVAKAADGYVFDHWSYQYHNGSNLVDRTNTNATWGSKQMGLTTGNTSYVYQGTTIYAHFRLDAPPTYIVTWKSEDGLTTLETDADLASGTATSFDAATPTKAATSQYTYTFDGWATEANGAKVYNINGTPAATADATYYAHFSQTTNTYTVSATVSPAEAGTVSGTGTYDYDTDVTLTAYPANRRYRFVRWMESLSEVGTDDTYTINDIAAPHTLVAEFEEVPVTLDDNEETAYYTATGSTFIGEMDFQLMRTFYAGMWNTVCFPFDLNASQIAASDMSDATFYTLSSVTGDAAEGLDFNVSEVTALSARTPYLVQCSSNIVNPVFEGVTLATSAFTNNTSGTDAGETKFFGTVHPTSLEIGESSGFLFLGQNNQLYWPNVANNIRAFRAYFYSGDGVVQSVHPRARIVVRGETPTGVIEGYDADGDVRAPSKYIDNGNLIIERDGKRYNAVGQEIR